jgi:hypothetical protein
VVFVVALVGLLGVVIGGVLNGVVTAAVERVRDARAALVVARLVQNDLTFIQSVLEVEIDRGVWMNLTAGAPTLSFDAWHEGRGLLASSLTFQEWSAVCVAAQTALRAVQMAALTNAPRGEPIDPEVLASMRTMSPRFDRAIEVLQPLSHGHRVPSLWKAMRPKTLEPAA